MTDTSNRSHRFKNAVDTGNIFSQSASAGPNCLYIFQEYGTMIALQEDPSCHIERPHGT